MRGAMTTLQPKVPNIRDRLAKTIPLTVNHLSQAYSNLYAKLYGAITQPPAAQKQGR